MFGEHASFIIPSYIISAAALVISVILIRRIYGNRKRELENLEHQGAKRRSEAGERNG